jgi:hypothetical protein
MLFGRQRHYVVRRHFFIQELLQFPQAFAFPFGAEKTAAQWSAELTVGKAGAMADLAGLLVFGLATCGLGRSERDICLGER